MSGAGTVPEASPRWPYAVASVALVIDQTTKQWFAANYGLYESREVIPGFFNFTLARNTGAAFSLFRDHPEALLLFSVLVFGLMVVFRHHMFSRRTGDQVAFGLLLGGIVGNLIDRMKYGYVVDFLDVYVGQHHWPIFNFADSWICIGVGIYLFYNYRKPRPAGAP